MYSVKVVAHCVRDERHDPCIGWSGLGGLGLELDIKKTLCQPFFRISGKLPRRRAYNLFENVLRYITKYYFEAAGL